MITASAGLTVDQAAAIARGKRQLELMDEVHLEIIFERQCLALGVVQACEKLEQLRARVVRKMSAAGNPFGEWPAAPTPSTSISGSR